MKVKFVLLLLVLSLILAGCSGAGKIVGKWQEANDTVYEFFKDGTLVVSSYGIQMTGVYEFVDNDTIKITMDGLLGIGGASVLDISFSGSQLRLNADGVITTLEKVK